MTPSGDAQRRSKTGKTGCYARFRRFGAAVTIIGLTQLGCRARWQSAPATEETPVLEETPTPTGAETPVAPTTSAEEPSSAGTTTGWQVVSLAQAGFGNPEGAAALVQRAADAAVARLSDHPPAESVTAATELMEQSRLTAAGVGAAPEANAQLDALVVDSLAGFGRVTLFDPRYSPTHAALQLVRNPGLAISGFEAFEALRLVTKPLHPSEAFSASASSSMSDDQADAGSRAAPTRLRGPVSVLLRTSDGRFAAALSDGGRTSRIPGELSAVSQPGVSVYCGSLGVVSVTWATTMPEGPIARMAYEQLREGQTALDVSSWVIHQWGDEGELGVGVLTKQGVSAQTNGPWAYAKGVGEVAR